MTIQDRTIVLTGGTSGIGFEMVQRLKTKNRVVVVSRPSPRLIKLADSCPEISIVPADLSKPREFRAVADKVLSELNQIDILINNAAIQFTPTFLSDQFEYDNINREISLNFTAVCSLSYLLLPALLVSCKRPRIVNINSGLALAPKKSSAVYCATKAAMDSFSVSLSYQLADTNVRVLQAFLPLVDTAMTQGRGKGKISAQRAADEILGGIEKGTKSNNIGKVKLLRLLMRLSPMLAYRIMKSA